MYKSNPRQGVRVCCDAKQRNRETVWERLVFCSHKRKQGRTVNSERGMFNERGRLEMNGQQTEPDGRYRG